MVALAILPEDQPMMGHRMADALSLDAVKSQIAENNNYLAYFSPRCRAPDYDS